MGIKLSTALDVCLLCVPLIVIDVGADIELGVGWLEH